MTTPADNDFVTELRERLESQPWYRRFANTVTSGVGAVFLILWLLTANGVDIPSQVTTGVGSAIAVLTVLGVLKTKNGLTPRGVEDIREYIGKHRK
ncbi:holin [Gordonia phage Fribs8]|nr:holin [Gordonia phage Fribs8]